MRLKLISSLIQALTPSFFMFGGGGPSGLPQIGHSLRLRAAASAYLSRTFGTPTTSGKGCFSVWTKRGTLGTTQAVLSAGSGTSSEVGFNTSNQVYIQHNGVVQATSTAVFRDTSAVYHFVFRFNGSSLSEVYVNNTLVVSWANSPNLLNTAVVHGIGARPTPTNYSDGLVSRACFVDGGHTLTPSDFAYTDPATNQWFSKSQAACKAAVDAGGANSFMLDFDNGTSLTTLGYDKSAKGNNWTLNNVSLTAGATYDWLTDTPTNNYATLNPLTGTGTTSYTNLRNTIGNNSGANSRATIAVSSGKWYWETTISTVGAAGIGITKSSEGVTLAALTSFDNYTYVASSGNKISLSGGAVAYGASYTSGDVIGVALDLDAGTLEFFKNNASQGVAFTGLSGEFMPSIYGGSGTSISTLDINFGQRPFAYTPPTGFKSLCTKNLPVPSIKLPKGHFGIVLHSTNGAASQPFTGMGFRPGALWSKSRANAYSWLQYDHVRGVGNYLSSNSTAAETAYPTGLLSIDNDGFTLGAGFGADSARVMFGWKAGDTPIANNAGSIASQVSANVAAGFSIATFTGTGAAGTIGHGLGVAPKLVIYKNRDGTAANWAVGSSLLNGGASPWNYYLVLQTTAAFAASASPWNNTAPTSSVFSVGVNALNGVNHVAYCFAEVLGYSKIGSYTGNGSADGPFVWCGFRPRWVMVKRTDATSDWWIIDTARNTGNLSDLVLYPDLANAEGAGACPFDFVSNGLKARSATYNVSGGTYIFIAFAEAPFNYANAR
jgi:hypothetical protein